jgi:L-fuculokinase
MEQAILVIDIGMTNKKVAVYDENLVQLDAVYKEFLPVMIRDPVTGKLLPSHDISGMEAWFTTKIRMFAQLYPVSSISVTTHGATFVCIDSGGTVCAPCIFYTYEPGEDFQQEFYRICGTPEELQAETFTPRFSAMINLAKGIFFLKKHFAREFARTDTILTFPQYWTFLLTGKKAYEPTYLSCHTYLWKQNEHQWSSVADSLEIHSLMPVQYVSTCSVLGKILPDSAERLGLDSSVVVTSGIHDSNASLLPYLADRHGEKDFILNSTGTWCVCMHPVQDSTQKTDAVYAPDDIGKVVFFNRSAFDTPVKTAIFLGGMEIDTYVRLYQAVCGTSAFPASDMQSVSQVLSERRFFILPEVVPGSGQFPGSRPGIYEDGRFFPLADIGADGATPSVLHDEKLLFAALDISMVIQTETAVYRAGMSGKTAVYTEGGFRRNKLYNELLASVLPHIGVFLTNMKEATATGCAMSALIALSGKSYSEFGQFVKIEHTPVYGSAVSGYEAYKSMWLALAGAGSTI